MNIKFTYELMNRLDFPADAKSYLGGVCETLTSDERFRGDISKAEDLYFTERTDDRVSEILDSVSSHSETHIYTVQFCFLLLCTDRLRREYALRGIEDSLFWDLMLYLRCKLLECHNLCGLWGTLVFEWFHHHFLIELFALGRFQYIKMPFPYEKYEYGDICINRGDTVYSFHIPSSGPFPRDLRIDSYKRAFDFFGCKEKGYIPLICISWLLYPENAELFREGSNLLDFVRDFDIIGSEKTDAFYDSWRVFGKPCDTPVSELPEDTSLMRSFKKRMAEGGSFGEGCGIIIFDGKKIVNKAE